MALRAPVDPLIVVMGATGTGKSKLAVELATRFNGEIINGDAMQMYKGLPIITNKIPEAERNGIPHHLLDFIALDEEPWTVSQFVQESSRVISEIRSRGRIPILVGGTHYYAHALLLEDAILGEDGELADKTNESDDEIIAKWPILSQPTEEIFARLQEVDPEIAKRWHPRDRRKIQRSLRIWLQTGRKASDVYSEQKSQRARHSESLPGLQVDGEADNPVSGLRFPTLLLWLESEDGVLKERLNKRVDSMIANGLVEEARTLAQIEQKLNQQGETVDRSKGIWVSIGYKEMEPYLKAEREAAHSDSVEINRALQESVESVKAGTRRYAKRQNRYIRIRLADALADVRQLDHLFLLDGTDLSQWESKISKPAQELTESFLGGRDLPEPKSLSSLARKILDVVGTGNNAAQRVAQTCEVCDKILMTEKEWKIHISSRSHRNTIAAHKRQQESPTVAFAPAPGGT